ncbi:MAG: adenylate/guanylate cyclase domain-containing protein [Burkholderiaceae bacterium]|jgi:class 3 adenylate cyclase|nr:adenylate/guanylate cyclase domain-containing protein [Betaproteobacteria bacterium]MDA9884550.1 adenylate/guanylate cyclase domain-containing protein [Burkholderiaceae bacterium]MDC1457592.1 adenylate/guanylate cyclase domain-containing protein [Burkholderiaceae bacterium]MDG1108074.1 adenylate/guanylate cyclase domain-containing protein [Burkholderiaceae bacterium]MDO7580752.1 adenylate/guanylate cyclase domain-containing protein [Burkholderiaceae bacterium]
MPVIDRPETQYALSGELSIAYQVFGHGERDLLYVPGMISHLELSWDDERLRSFLTELGQHFRVIMLDKRGQGMSDRIDGATTLEERIDDLRAVMEAAHSQRATVFGFSEGGPLCVLFAASYPKKVESLILFGSMAKYWGSDDYPHRVHINDIDETLSTITAAWGKGHFLQARAADADANNAALLPIFSKMERMASSPSGVGKFMRANALIDVRSILPDVPQKTLIIHRRYDKSVDKSNGRYLAEHLPHATYLELPTTSHLPQFEDSDAIAEAIVSFAKASHRVSADLDDRKLSTALFTDIVGSTAKLIEMGDEAWRNALNRHDAVVEPLIARYRGRLVKNTGDGILAVFDGPVRALNCALALVVALEEIGLPIRAGLHVGEVVDRGGDVTGIAVNIASRVMDKAGAGEVLLTRTLKDLTGGSDMRFESAGDYELKGLSEPYQLFRTLGLEVAAA